MAAAVQQVPLHSSITTSGSANLEYFVPSMPDGLSTTHSATSISQPQDDSHIPPRTQTTGGIAAAAQSGIKKRRVSKTKIPAGIRRAASTPHMRSAASSEGGTTSPTIDKKRNKLGYHRTSVACGHCRRRKIRCLLAADDPQNRCSNCIRLKKECNFYPVEQEGQNPQGQQGKSEGSSNAPTTSNPSSPHNAEEYNRYPDHYHPDSAVQGMAYAYGEANHAPSHWDSSDSLRQSSQHEPRSEAQGSSQWRPDERSFASPYASESKNTVGHRQSSSSHDSVMSYGHPEAQAWGPPQRSMSLSNGDMAHQYPQGAYYQQHQQQGYPDRQAQFYPPPINTSIASSYSMPMSAPVSAPIPNSGGPHFSYPRWTPQQESSASQHAPPVQPGYGAQSPWYTEPSSLHKVDEEVVPASNNHYAVNPHYFAASHGA